MSGNFQTLPGSASLDLSGVNPGQLLQKDNFGAIIGTDPSDGPDFSNVGTDELIKRIDGGYLGYNPSALGENKTIKVAAANADRTSIQAAINAAAFGDVVQVLPGTYDEALTLRAGVILYLHSGATVQYSEDDSNPTLKFGNPINIETDNPFFFNGSCRMFVLGEGRFLRFTQDGYGNAQETSVPTILIGTGGGNTGYFVTIQAREIGRLKQTGHRSAIYTDAVSHVELDGLGSISRPEMHLEAETIGDVLCRNGGKQTVQCKLITGLATADGADSDGGTFTPGTEQVIKAIKIYPDGDACWCGNGASQIVNAEVVGGCAILGGYQTVTANRIQSLSVVGYVGQNSVLYPGIGYYKASFIERANVLGLGNVFVDCSSLWWITVASGGICRVRAHVIGADKRLYDDCFSYGFVGGSSAPDQVIILQNNDLEPTLPPSYLEIVGARIVQATQYNATEPTYAIEHASGNLVLRDCVIEAAVDAPESSPYCIHSQYEGDGTTTATQGSLSLYGQNYSNMPLFRPLDGSSNPIPPRYGTLTVVENLI